MVRVPPEAYKVHITMVLVFTRKHYGAPVEFTREATRKLLGLIEALPVAQLTNEEQLVKGILTKPMRLPLVNVSVNVNAFSRMIIPNIPIPS